jgi:mevalonate kinase
MKKTWYSNGKLILTGEYMISYGAVALAIPVKYGQSLKIVETPGNASLIFSTEVLDKPWFEAEYYPDSFEIFETTNISNALYLQTLLRAARSLNPDFLRDEKQISAMASINFNISWGLGSSSSLISNVAWWADVDPFKLNRLISKGSGCDIACARSKVPILFSLKNFIPKVESVKFNPDFSDHIWFIYLEQKQSSRVSLHELLENTNPSVSDINEISEISNAFLNVNNISELSDLMKHHEMLISKILGIKPIQLLHFPDFKGTIKSLGAWGGDFCMVVTDENEEYVKQYFEQKGLKNILTFKELSI